MSLVTIFTGVHKSPHTTPKNSKLANLAIVAVIVLVPLKLIRKNAKCVVLEANPTLTLEMQFMINQGVLRP